jgi:cysteine desulfurase
MPQLSNLYLDYAAATPVDGRVLAAMQPYFADQFYNPSATYAAATQVRRAVETARAQVAHWLGVLPNEIVFTAGGTEANNLAIHGLMRQYPEANVVASAVEHESVLAPAGSYDCRKVGVRPDGTVDLEQLRELIDDKTVLVSIMYANNEIGTIQPLREVSRIIEAKRRERGTDSLPLYLHTDACQAANYLDLHVARLGVDLLTLNGGKVYGPKQSGALYIRRTISLEPLIDGGGQERRLRSGTENVAGNIGFAAALDLAQSLRHEEAGRLQTLQRHFMQALEEHLPNVIINGTRARRLPNNVHVTLPGSDNERLLLQLDERGIQAAAGSACSASDETPSHVLQALGLAEADARASLRFTLGRQTTAADIERAVTTLQELITD